MLESLIHFVESVILPLGGWGIFAASVIEELIIPVPSALIQMGGGFILMQGVPVTPMSLLRFFFILVIPAAAGLTIGSLATYALGRYFGEPFFRKFGKWIGVTWEEVIGAVQKLDVGNRVFVAIVITRSIPTLPAMIVSIASGLMKVGYSHYMIATFIGTIIRAAILGMVGWQLGAAYTSVIEYVDKFEKIGFVILAILVIAWWIWKKRRNKAKVPSLGEK